MNPHEGYSVQSARPSCWSAWDGRRLDDKLALLRMSPLFLNKKTAIKGYNSHSSSWRKRCELTMVQLLRISISVVPAPTPM
jgi:hypothetical protein